MTTQEGEVMQGRPGSAELGIMQGTTHLHSAEDTGTSTSQTPKLTPPSSPQNNESFPRLPGKGFASTHRNFQSLRLNEANRQPPTNSNSPPPPVVYSPLSSHPTSPTRTSGVSQTSVKLFHSPRVRNISISTKSPSPVTSPTSGQFPSGEPSSPTRLKNKPTESSAIPEIPEDSEVEDSGYSLTLQVGKLGDIVRPSTATGRSRGSTTSSPLPHQRVLRTATSIPDYGPYRVGQRSIPSTTYKPDRGALSREALQSPLRREPQKVAESVRNSFRSGFTVGSSSLLDTSGTERSSIVSKSDTASEFAFNFNLPPLDKEELRKSMSVEDAIGMYEAGFFDDPPEVPEIPEEHQTGPNQKDAPDFKDEGYVSQATLARSASGQESSTTTASQHERAASLEKSDGEKLEPQMTRALSLPKTHHTRSSTQIIAGRASATPSTMSDLSPPAARDRYGFKKVSQHITLIEHDVWDFHYIEYLDRRRKKWVALMKKCGLSTENPKEFPPESDTVKRYIRKGLPPDWRGAAWFFYAGGPQKLAQNPTLYADLMEQINQGDLSDLDREHIERDLHRTFPDNIRFKPEVDSSRPTSVAQSFERPDSTATENETSILKALRRVLQAFAIHNPNIGYCQSLNFLAGLLLLFLEEDEEKAFILLNIVTTEHLPGTHGKVLGANIDIGVLMGCIKESMPLVWAAIDDTNDPSGHSSHVATAAARLPTVSLATTSWFMSLFVSSLPIETVLRVWDCLFYEGSKTLFRIALAIFKIGEDYIRAVTDPMEIFQIVQNLPRKLLNANGLMETCFKKRNGFGHLTQETIDQRRSERRRLNADDVNKLTTVKKATTEGEDESRSISSRTNTLDDTFERLERERWAQEPQPLVKRATTRSKFKRSLSRKKTAPSLGRPPPPGNMI